MQKKNPRLPPLPKVSLADQRGQIVVEYVLLVIVGVAVATLITTTMVSRSSDSPGFLVKKWADLIRVVGQDPADDLAATN